MYIYNIENKRPLHAHPRFHVGNYIFSLKFKWSVYGCIIVVVQQAHIILKSLVELHIQRLDRRNSVALIQENSHIKENIAVKVTGSFLKSAAVLDLLGTP